MKPTKQSPTSSANLLTLKVSAEETAEVVEAAEEVPHLEVTKGRPVTTAVQPKEVVLTTEEVMELTTEVLPVGKIIQTLQKLNSLRFSTVLFFNKYII